GLDSCIDVVVVCSGLVPGAIDLVVGVRSSGALGRLNLTGRLCNNRDILVLVKQIISDGDIIVNRYVLGDVLIGELVGLAVSNDLCSGVEGNLRSRHSLDNSKVDLIVVVGVNQSDDPRRNIVLEVNCMPVFSFLLAVFDNGNTVRLKCVQSAVDLDLGIF